MCFVIYIPIVFKEYFCDFYLFHYIMNFRLYTLYDNLKKYMVLILVYNSDEIFRNDVYYKLLEDERSRYVCKYYYILARIFQ